MSVEGRPAGEIPWRVSFTWGLGSFGTIAYLNVVTALVLVYLTTIMKIDPGTAGLIVFIARLVDAISDPLMLSLIHI